MRGSGDKAKHEHTFGHYGVNHDRTENIVIFAQIDYDVGTFGHRTAEVNRCDGRLCVAYIKSFGYKAFLQCFGYFPEVFFVLRLILQNFKTLERTYNHGHG